MMTAMDTVDYLVTALPLAVGAWAAWWAPRWADRPRRDRSHPGDWTAGDLPSRPYRDVHRLP